MKMEGTDVETDKLGPSLPMAVSPAGLPDGLADQPRREQACCPDLPVGKVVEPVPAKGLRTEGDAGDFVQGLVVGLEGSEQNKPVFGGGSKFEFDGLSDQHMSI